MKSIIALFSMLLSLNIYAYNSEYFELKPGKTISIDVANKDVISLTLETFSKESNAIPTFKRLSAVNGFECEYKNTLLLFSGFDMASKTFHKVWEVQVNWEAGADYSGCLIEVNFPGLESSQAELYMNY